MSDDNGDESEWSRQSLLERGPAPAITRTAVLPYTEEEPGNLRKV
jgi:hypothetical protein